jgi:uncharacterized membrane protein YbhN (UPF0104 family)
MNDAHYPPSKKPSLLQQWRPSVSDIVWKTVGIAALVVSIWLLSRDLRDLSLEEVASKLTSLPATAWIGGAVSTLAAYLLLGFYDRLALSHLRRKIDAGFTHLCAAATYAFAHMVGASVFSGAVIRYRAYSSRGLSGAEVALLVIFCTVTFVIGVATVLGAVLIAQPFIVDRFLDTLPLNLTSSTGKLMVGLVFLYVVMALLPKKAIKLRSVEIVYPRFWIAASQVAVASAEILAAALILYLALPESSNPGFVVVTGIFIFSFAAGLISHSPAGLGVFELAFITGLSDVPEVDVLSALLIFRLFYSLIPFIFSLIAISAFELEGRR